MTNTNENVEGAWVFLSHSHRDIHQVRQIRDELERRGHSPLMFYLKCLDGDDPQLPDLLRREIAARDWFILCDSPNSRASSYVQEEISIIKKKGKEGKVFEVIDLSRDLQDQLYKLIALSKRATVFLSYSRKDDDRVRQIASVFRGHDYRVFLPADTTSPGENFRAIQEAIDRAVQQGFFIPLLSSSSLRSYWVQAEVKYAFDKLATDGPCSSIVPVFLDKPKTIIDTMPPAMQMTLSVTQGFDMSGADLAIRTEDLIRELQTRQMK